MVAAYQPPNPKKDHEVNPDEKTFEKVVKKEPTSASSSSILRAHFRMPASLPTNYNTLPDII